MTVYVDDMYRLKRGKYRGMRMSHMIADTAAELHAMADAIGVARKHFQQTASGPHYDICLAKRDRAVRAGAREIPMRAAACMMARWRATGELGEPGTAVAWVQDRAQRGVRGA